jgi:hypothetical protein
MLIESGNLFGSFDSTIPQMMDGLPRNSFPSEFNFIVLFFYLFPPFIAYALNLTLMHFVAFFGMYLLLSTHFIRKQELDYIAIGAALCFALLPFWPFGGLSIAGMPLALYSFLNIRRGFFSYKDWIVIGILPFYSSFVLSFVFFLTLMGLIWLFDVIWNKKWNPYFIGAIILMSLIFLVVDYRLVYSMFLDSGYVSHRTEFVHASTDLPESIKTSISNFIYGQYHAVSLHTLWIGITILVAEVFFLLEKIGIHFFEGKKRKDAISICVLLLVIIQILSSLLNIYLFTYLIWGLIILLSIGMLFVSRTNIRSFIKCNEKVNLRYCYNILLYVIFGSFILSLFYGFWSWEYVNILKQELSILNSFNFSRFHFLHPIFWYISFGLSLSIISKKLTSKKMVQLFIILQVVLLFFVPLNGSYQQGGAVSFYEEQITFEEFYSPTLFGQIETYIDKPQEEYRVTSLGLHPAISQYNGFYTLDGYYSNYPLSYKNTFANIISNELNKNKIISAYFYNWGSRCYLFTDETGKDFMITKSSSYELENLELNHSALNNWDDVYIFSAVKIENYDENNLKFHGVFENNKSPWKVWVYEVL